MGGEGTLDYELYLNTKKLLSCQSPFAGLCNRDELQFQIVHQIEELWMKLIAYTLLDIDEYLQQENTNRVITLFRRVHLAQKMMIDQLALLETMSPKEYQEIRKRLGNGSGQESPGFNHILEMAPDVYEAFAARLAASGVSLLDVHRDRHVHQELFALLQALMDVDAWFQRFREAHYHLVKRVIGSEVRSLRGVPASRLEHTSREPLFPPLWQVINELTELDSSAH